MITYKQIEVGKVAVFLVGKRVGTIVTDAGGWRYYPKDAVVGGTKFPTLALVKASLEAE